MTPRCRIPKSKSLFEAQPLAWRKTVPTAIIGKCSTIRSDPEVRKLVRRFFSEGDHWPPASSMARLLRQHDPDPGLAAEVARLKAAVNAPGARSRGGPGRQRLGQPGLRPEQGKRLQSRRDASARSSGSRADVTESAQILTTIDRPQRRFRGPRHPRSTAACRLRVGRPHRDHRGESTRSRTWTASTPRTPVCSRSAAPGSSPARLWASASCLVWPRGSRPKEAHAVILGRSQIVGKSMALLLLQKGGGGDATVTDLPFAATRDVDAQFTRQADLLIAAIGQSRIRSRPTQIKPGAVVDRRRDEPSDRMERLCGDVELRARSPKIASWITPVPGGVGPMTVAMLLRNTLDAFRRLEKARRLTSTTRGPCHATSLD